MIRTAVATGAVVVGLGLGLGLGLGAVGVAGAGRDAGVPRAAAGASTVEPAADAGVVGGPGEVGDRGAVGGKGTVGDKRAVGDPGAAAARGYAPPLDPPVVVARPFDGPPVPWAAGHRGVDLAAGVGQTVRAPRGGVVTFAGTVVDRGVVTVTHDDGLRSSLEPVRWAVRPGELVARGQPLGTVADAPGHCAPATCLHWGLRRGDAYLDPMRWVLDRGPVVLLPGG